MRLLIGESFPKTSLPLRLFPGVTTIPNGLLTLEIQYTNQDYYSYTVNACNRENLIAEIGTDVYSMDIKLSRYYVYTGMEPFCLHYRIRIDNLILLNLVCKLLSL